MRGKRVGLLALAASLLLHLGVLGDGASWFVDPPESLSFEVRLATRPPSVSLPAAPAPRLTPHKADAVLDAPPEPAPVEVPVADVAETAIVIPELAGAEGASVTVEAAAPEPAAASVEMAAAPLNVLPPRLDIQYAVRYGIASGTQSLVWVRDGDRYTLTSVARASGLAGVFYRGEFGQTSVGRITLQGLQPETFRDQRGDQISRAQFDTQALKIHFLPAQGEPRDFSYTGSAQDALSLFFQLALIAPPQGRVSYAVFNGKKLRDYHYDVRGEGSLDTALGSLRTLHLVRVGRDDERFEAWLAVDRHYLPVRVVRSDDRGNEIELRVQSIMP